MKFVFILIFYSFTLYAQTTTADNISQAVTGAVNQAIAGASTNTTANTEPKKEEVEKKKISTYSTVDKYGNIQTFQYISGANMPAKGIANLKENGFKQFDNKPIVIKESNPALPEFAKKGLPTQAAQPSTLGNVEMPEDKTASIEALDLSTPNNKAKESTETAGSSPAMPNQADMDKLNDLMSQLPPGLLGGAK